MPMTFKNPTDAGNPHRNLPAMTRRLLECWGEASADDLASGIAWYSRAETAAAAMASGPITARDAAGIVASLSPRNRWNVNLAQAAKVITHALSGTLDVPAVSTLSNRGKAWRIATGESPDVALSGPKVRAFFANITGDHDAVTVDVWAARAAEGCSIKAAPTGGRYNAIADAYRAAADAAGVTPREMQAAVWVHVRGSAD